MKKRFIFIFCCILLGCGPNGNRKQLSDERIMSVMVDKYAFPLPPPPPINKKESGLSKEIIDSLLSLRLKVAIYPVMENIINESELNKIPKVYQKLLDPGLTAFQIDDINGITSKKNHVIVLADTVELKKSMDFKNYDLLFRFSRILYDKDKTKAIFELGVSRSRLAGSAYILCMKREKDNWIVDYTVPTTEW